MDLLSDCFELGHKPYDLNLNNNILKGLVSCGDYLTCNNGIFILNNNTLIDCFDNCETSINFNKSEELISSVSHPLLKESLF